MKNIRSGLLVLCMLLATAPLASAMTALGDGDLSAIRAGSGVSQDITGDVRITVGSLYHQDTDTGNRIELNQIVWDDGSGGAFSVATPAGDPSTIDIGTISGRTYVKLHDSTQVQPRTFSANLNFLDYSLGAYSFDPGYYDPLLNLPDWITDYNVQNLGTIKVSDIVRTENSLIIGAHGGIDFEFREKIDIGEVQYNDTNHTLTLTGIHLCSTASGNPEADPTTWTYSGPFQIGDIAGGNPAQIDVGTDNAGVTSVRYELPMEGTLRVQNVNFGGTDFGALALDGIAVHRLEVQFHP